MKRFEVEIKQLVPRRTYVFVDAKSVEQAKEKAMLILNSAVENGEDIDWTEYDSEPYATKADRVDTQ